MKLTKISRRLGLISVGFILAGSVCVVQAQPYPSYIVDQFDTDTTGNYANQGWGAAVPIITWDDTQNATTTMGPNNPGSGSSLWSITWPTTGDQFMVARYFNNSDVINLEQYTNISFDIMFDPSSATDGASSYGDLLIAAIPQSGPNAGWPSTVFAEYDSAVTNGNGWIHVSIPINAVSDPTDLGAVEGLGLKMQQNRSGANLTGTTKFWLDNIIFGGQTNLPPPPTLSISAYPSPPPPGLMIVCGGLGGTYTRGILMAFDTVNGTRNFSWVGSGATPVTYSQTVVSYPDTNHPIQSAIFLVQNGNFGDAGVDYDAANVAQLSMYGNADGTATASFQYKTNQPDGNSQFTLNTLATLTAPSPLGTWSLTFLNDTNVALGWAPLGGGAGLSTNANFPDETTVKTYFANPLSVFMGNQQNADANLGQSSTYSEFKISGVTESPSLDDVWSNQTTMDTTNWGKVAYGNDMLLVHSTDKYWVNWTLPDSGFSLSISTNLAAGENGWMDAGLSQIVNTSAGNRVLLPGLSTSYPTGAKNVFFSLIERQFTQLQVLWPGQTNAPGTANGYIGTAAPVNEGDNVTVTINACDSTWHVVNTTSDQIELTSATAVVGNNVNLVNGTATNIVVFVGPSSGATVTATDLTNTNIPPATSTAINVN